MSAIAPIEMTDVTSQAVPESEADSDSGGSDMDEETGLTKRERRQKIQQQQQQQQQQQWGARGGEHIPVTKQEARIADRDVIRKSIINTVLILLWYVFSLAISIYNKWMFDGEHLDFHFPLFTTSLHMLVQFCLSSLVLFFVPSLRPSHNSQPYSRLPTNPSPSDDFDADKPRPVITPIFWLTRLLPCGTATSLDIGLGNTSLRYITLTFLTMCKSSSLAFVLLFAFLFGLESPSYKLVFIIAAMTVGVVMMVAGEADFKPLGFALVIASSFFSGFRWGLTQILLLRHPATSNPFATLFFLAPIMFISLLTIAVFAEGPGAVLEGLSDLAARKGNTVSILLLLFPGCLAFCMTTSEYSLLQRTNVVTLSICGIFKEVVTITAAEVVYHDPLTPINVSGLLITMGSIASYNYLKITKMREEARKEVALAVTALEPPVGSGGRSRSRRRSSLGTLDDASSERAGLFAGEQRRSGSADPMSLASTERGRSTPIPPKRRQDLELGHLVMPNDTLKQSTPLPGGKSQRQYQSAFGPRPICMVPVSDAAPPRPASRPVFRSAPRNFPGGFRLGNHWRNFHSLCPCLRRLNAPEQHQQASLFTLQSVACLLFALSQGSLSLQPHRRGPGPSPQVLGVPRSYRVNSCMSMASETKRQNAGNRAPVALPNSGPPPPSPTVSLDTALSGVIGARVRVTTSPPTSATFEGLLYTADPITNLVVLSVPPSSTQTITATAASTRSPTSSTSTPATNIFKILPIPQITSFTILCLPTNNTPQQPANPNLPQPVPLPQPLLTSRVNSTIATIKLQDARRGRNVTREAQDIFDGIARTYPARWMGTSMLVNENIVIDSPYGVEDCRLLDAGREMATARGGQQSKDGAAAAAEQGLLRIKKVLGMEREKLALRRGLGLGLGSGVGSKGSKRGVGAGAGGVGVSERKGG